MKVQTQMFTSCFWKTVILGTKQELAKLVFKMCTFYAT